MKFLFAVTAILFSTSAWALIKTESNMSPDASEFQLSVGVAGVSANELADDSTGAAINGFLAPASFYYGFTDHHAIGIETGYSSLSNKSDTPGSATITTKTSGMNDISIAYLGNFDWGSNTLFVKVSGQIPSEEYKEDDVAHKVSASKGRPGGSLQAGMVFPASDSLFIGFDLSYTKLFQGNLKLTYQQDALDVDTINGNSKDGGDYEAVVFVEGNSKLHPHLELSYEHEFATHYTFDNRTFTSSAPGSEDLQLTGTLTCKISDSVELIPLLLYSTLLNKTELQIKTYNFFAAGLQARFTF